jgi:polyisoprenoid-binding protein YceI
MLRTLAVVALLWSVTASAQTYQVNVKESNVEWLGANVVGKTHTGTLKLSEGKVEVKNGKLTGGTFTVDMTSLDNTDLSGGMKDKLVGHLKSDDFFSVDKFQTSLLVITKVTEKDGKYEVTGKLTIKGKTETVTFPATLSVNGNVLTATADVTFDRSKYDVRYGSDSFFDNLGDKAIKNNIELKVSLSASKGGI